MANLKETDTWETGIYQLETTDPVVGGVDGISNKQAKQLANRTLYLKTELTKAQNEISKKANAATTTQNFEWVKQQVSIRYTKEETDGRFLKIAAKASDSDKLDGLDSSAFSRSDHNHNEAYLGKTAKASDSDKLGGLDASRYALASKLFGVSQSIRDVWNDREFGVFYHNNTSRPKCIYMCFEAKVNATLQVFINGTVVYNCDLDPNITATFSLVVPPDASYKVVCGSLTKQQVVLENKTYSSWVEMG